MSLRKVSKKIRQDLIPTETNLREGEIWDRGMTRGERSWVCTCFPAGRAVPRPAHALCPLKGWWWAEQQQPTVRKPTRSSSRGAQAPPQGAARPPPKVCSVTTVATRIISDIKTGIA